MEELLTWTEGRLGRLRLNRPRAINSLTRAMIDRMDATLTAWETDAEVVAVLLDGAGERGLCSGADVRALREGFLSGDPAAAEFLPTEFALNARVATYPKPYVAWMDGVVMGGGLGVSTHGSLRLATPRATMAMPETIIGFFPDVGVTYQLGHAPGELGTHLALTGLAVTGADAVHLGLADALVDPAVLDDLCSGLRQGAVPSPAEIGDTAPDAPLVAERGWIDECYAATGASDATGLLDEARLILRRLRAHPSDAARETAAVLEQRSPLSVVVALVAVRQARTMSDVPEVLARDGRIGPPLIVGPDFIEGVRAQLVDKDRSPVWSLASLDEVTPAHVSAIVG
ncbi:3-hydroxyisobutyryl-CoA hydrolase [Propionicicella superfundia]|uniref:3-hydroxyisobutyryl-CoA hydrolase n=1 Tax=Propionicicella superfundia TaxID=348582 RepID=UPI001B7F99DE|nr:3-hydroxyisobutyryl-CoA hydrolase [Propionicicella superfundia]